MDRKYKYAGIHGICALLSPELKDAVDLIPDTKSECVFWLKLHSVTHGDCIIGSVYIPCDTSRFHFEEVFCQIENDITQTLLFSKPLDLAQVCHGNKICSKPALTWKLTLVLAFPAHCISN